MNKQQKKKFDNAMKAAEIAAEKIPSGFDTPNGWQEYNNIEDLRDMQYAKHFNNLARDVRDAAAAKNQKVPGCIVYKKHDATCRYQNGAWAFRCTVGCPDCM